MTVKIQSQAGIIIIIITFSFIHKHWMTRPHQVYKVKNY